MNDERWWWWWWQWLTLYQLPLSLWTFLVFSSSAFFSFLSSPLSSTPGGGAFDHHEPIIGIGSNHNLTDTTVYDDDWMLHYSNQDLMPYYRRFDSLEDGLHMNGNCQNASTNYPNREAFPCFYNQVTYGLAVSGFDVQASICKWRLFLYDFCVWVHTCCMHWLDWEII